jgi:integrase
MDTDTAPRRLTDVIVKRLSVPVAGNRITYDTEVKGFGARVTAAGHRAFILGYWTRIGRQRRYTIGAFPDWSTPVAREEAKRLKREIDAGGDPLATIESAKAEPTVSELIDRVVETHFSRRRHRTAAEYERLLKLHIRPALGKLRVSEVRFSDIDLLHRKITKAGSPVAANRAHSLCRTIFNFAVRLKLRPDNPCVGVERNPEHPVERYLTRDELERLTAALDQEQDQQAADIFRLLLLSGARIGEVLSARWEHIDLDAGTWSKPHLLTKQAKRHVVLARLSSLIDALGRLFRWSCRRSSSSVTWRRLQFAMGLRSALGVNSASIHISACCMNWWDLMCSMFGGRTWNGFGRPHRQQR